MKGSTARRILKFYGWLGITVIALIALVSLFGIIMLFIENWIVSTVVFGILTVICVGVWICLCADVDKHNPD